MNTLTLDIFKTLDASQLAPALAIENAESELRSRVLAGRASNLGASCARQLDLGYADMLAELGDKPINGLAAAVKRFITDGPDDVAKYESTIADAATREEYQTIKYVVDERAASLFLDSWRGKDKLPERRATLLSWFAHEREAVDELRAQVEKERAPAVRPARKNSRARRMLSTVSDAGTIANLAKEALAAGDTATADQLSRAAESGMMVVVATPNVIRSAGPAPTRSGGGRAPTSDKYAGMDVDALRAEVKSMFGVETGMKALPHLRYRLRLGAKAMARGERPVWNPASNVARIQLPVLRSVVAALSLTAHHFGTGPERAAVDGHIATLTEAIRRAEASANQDSSSDDSAPDAGTGDSTDQSEAA